MWAFPWGLRPDQKKKKTQNVPEMQRRARLLMKLLDEQKAQIVIPSVIIAELLAGIDPAKHARVMGEFHDRFFCPPFDVNACPLAARLWQFERGLPGIQIGLPPVERSERRILKSDILIVATAKMAGATMFYSHDEKCRRLATEAGMQARELPTTTGNWISDWEATQRGRS